MKTWLLGVLILLVSGSASAVMHREPVTYKDGDVDLKGIFYWDDAFEGRRPGILVVHEWWGLNDYAKLRAEMLAELGYVALAADMYGDGKITRHAEDAKGWMQQITSNIEAWQRRADLALAQLKGHARVDPAKLAAIGYCFGGATVMQMAYAGADLKGVVSFHGSLPPATPEQAANIKTQVLVAHGDADGFVPPDRVQAFKSALAAAGVDWEMDIYANAMHGFTNPYADGYGMDGLAYQEQADRRSWLRMLAFFDEIFGEEF
ncbi:MAG: dienelactone hydrolase family protein [Chromatiaceae bacterium]|nr:dienelactone hydrolase family protein [Chromatiaceae bacterium]